MVDFSGWDMPVEYPKHGGLMKEHLAVRNGVGVFDVSHMGDIRIHGPQALAAVQHITMNDASKLAIGQCQYSAMLYPEGTFVDDVIVHRLGEDDYLLVINAGTREKDVDWVTENTQAVRLQGRAPERRLHPDRDPGPQGRGNPAEADRRRPVEGEVLLVHLRHGLRPAQYADRSHRLHRRRRL